jgi:hypothetical protein
MVGRPESVSCQSEEILNDSVNVQESLRLIRRLEASRLSFSLSGWLLR